MKLYWTTKDGTKLDVDDMSPEHIKNAFKMMLRNIELHKLKAKAEAKAKRRTVTLNGDMAQHFNDIQEEAMFDDCDDSFPY